MHEMITWLRDLPAGWFAALALAQNAALVGAAALLGHWLLRLPAAPGRVSRLELGLVAAATVRWVATPAMHAGHHAAPRYNLGFYTTVWDRLFGTLDPDYDARRTGARPFADTTVIGIPTVSPAG